MAGAGIMSSAGVCLLASLASTIQPASADTSISVATLDSDTASYTEQSAFRVACNQPDAGTLSAIVPVATDHGSHASGVVFDDNRVLTAAHAVQGAGHFFVQVGDSFHSADLVMVDHAHDLAVLAVDTASILPLRISGFSPAFADPVWAAGYPRAQTIKTSMGVFQQLSGGALHTSATIDSGQSGGGLLSCSQGQWSLVGMLRGYGAYLEGDQYVKMKNHSVSVAGTTIHEFLRTFP